MQSLQEIIRTTVITSKIKATPHFNYKGKKGIVSPGIGSWEFTDGMTWKIHWRKIFFHPRNICRYFSCVYFMNIHLLRVKRKSWGLWFELISSRTVSISDLKQNIESANFLFLNSLLICSLCFLLCDLDFHPQDDLEKHLFMEVGWQENLSCASTKYLL